MTQLELARFPQDGPGTPVQTLRKPAGTFGLPPPEPAEPAPFPHPDPHWPSSLLSSYTKGLTVISAGQAATQHNQGDS